MKQFEQSLVPNFVIQKVRQNQFSGRFKAATLFVDISGFTKLTETFLTHHREGAEALTNALREIFSPQIDILTRRGGFIPFFAGDAFVAIFPYDDPDLGSVDAPFHALKTAFEIQKYFCYDGEHRLISTKHGTFGFGVKIGLSFGDVRWGIPGQAGRYSFYFRGEAIEGCAKAQQAAQTGQIVADTAVSAFWERDVVLQPNETPPFLQLLDDQTPTLPPNPTPLSATFDELHQFIPDPILHLTVNEFREVSTLFISLEPPKESETFHQLLIAIDDRVRQFGGYLNQIDISDKGCLLVVLFGAPIAYENNLMRAAAFVEQLTTDQLPVRWRAGMTFGLLWAGIRGGNGRFEYGVVGNEINLAARLAVKAEWGQVVVTDVVYRQLKDAYLFYALGKQTLKGKSEKVSLYLFNYRYDAVDFQDYQGEIVGRAEELQKLQQIAQNVFQNKAAQLVAVHGDVGVGKTRLIFEMRRKVLYKFFPQTFYCPADEIQRTSLNPFKRFLRTFFGLKPDFSERENKGAFALEFEHLLAQLPVGHPEAAQVKAELMRTRPILGAMVDLYWPDSLYEQLDPKLRFENTLVAFKNLLKAAALVRPVILHLENAQWLDADSYRLIELLIQTVQNYPILLICTARYLDDGKLVRVPVGEAFKVSNINLEKLSWDDVLTLAQSFLNTAVSPKTATFLTEKTDGNPFFVEQLLRDLHDRQLFTVMDDGVTLNLKTNAIKAEEIPATINTLLLARLDRLTYPVKQIVRAASVIGNRFQRSILERMLPDQPDLQQLIDSAEQQRIWFAEGNGIYQFKHALLRDAAYAMQLRSNIRVQHQLATHAIEAFYQDELGPHYSELAFHADKGERFDTAVHWYQLAGEQAASRYANVEALGYLDRALTLLRANDTERAFDLRLAREKVLSIQGEREAQSSELERLNQLADKVDDKKKQAVVAYLSARFAEVTGDYQVALTNVERAACLAIESHNTKYLVASHILHGKLFYRLGDYDQAHRWLKEGLAQAQINELASFEADSLRQIGIVFVDQHCLDEARHHYENALQIYRALGDSIGTGTTLNNIGVVAWNAGDLLQAQAYYNDALMLYEQVGNRRGKGMVWINLGLLVSKYGRFQTAIQYFEKAADELAEINERFGLSFVHLSLATAYNMMGDYERAHEHGRFVYQLADEIGAKRLVALALVEIGRALTHKRKIYGAEKAYQDALQIWQEMNHPELSIEAQAGMAHLHMLKNEAEESYAAVTQILIYFKANPDAEEKVEGLIFVLFTVYQVLRHVNDPEAQAVLFHTYKKLQEQAEKLNEAAIRQGFLQDVPLHKQIVDLVEQYSPKSTQSDALVPSTVH